MIAALRSCWPVGAVASLLLAPAPVASAAEAPAPEAPAPEASAPEATWQRLPLDGAPVEALLARSATAASIVGLGGLFHTEDAGKTWQRDDRVDPLRLRCGDQDLRKVGSSLVFRCNLPDGSVHCARLLPGGPKAACGPAERGKGPVPPPRKSPGQQRIAQVLGLKPGASAHVRVATVGKTVWVGHGRVGVLYSSDGGRTFAWRGRGLDGLAVVRLVPEGETVRADVAAPTVEALIHDGQPYVVAGTATCARKDGAWSCRWRPAWSGDAEAPSLEGPFRPLPPPPRSVQGERPAAGPAIFTLYGEPPTLLGTARGLLARKP